MFPSNFFYRPWIIQSHGANKHTTTFIDPIKKNIEAKEIVEMQGKFCIGCIDEWIFLCDKQSKEYFFLDLHSLLKVHLPPLPEEKITFTSFSLSTSPDHPDCTVILTGAILEDGTNEIIERVLMVCMMQEEKWNKLPLDEDFIAATDVILEGKLYTDKVGHVVVFDVLSLLAGQVDTRTIPTPMLVQYPRNDMVSVHLVESCGCIYLVRLYGYGGGPTIYMDIYRLDTSCDEWLRVDGIGERSFFLSDMSNISVCGNDVGVECNCIYYASSYGEDRHRIYKFCLDDFTMSYTTTPIEETEYESRFCWFVPTRSRRMIRDSSISPTRVLSVATVDGEEWNLASDSIKKAKTWPWLMYREKLDGTCKLLDPFTGKKYTTIVGLPSSIFPTQILSSKDGWVIVLDSANTMLMVNPLNQDVVELPFLEEFDGVCGITFTSVPTSPDCVVLGFCTNGDDSIDFYKWQSGEENWTIMFDDESHFSAAANTNPIFFREELYCLGESGQLGVFNPAEKTWELLDKPEPVYSEHEVPFRGTQDCYLLELGGDLVSIFKYNYPDFNVRIFKLDKLKMEWIPVEDLAGWTLFLDPRSSFAKPSPHKCWSNKIFFTTIHSGSTKTCAAYCIKSKRYDINFCDTKKPFDCVWLEPNLIGKY
ncbi:hypothetical protein LUZ61_009305 [Rhynchospora tenuis]|uniref:KIB1-4 beta-propeller domain-containing protein n=1 Tax=Rhynchospora tenuis TaxID=198213 RepID=A0AAD5ZWZ5_9POAL|nr:hypothetical protein LUZ61_009305 [Rhynchospora tenuis]